MQRDDLSDLKLCTSEHADFEWGRSLCFVEKENNVMTKPYHVQQEGEGQEKYPKVEVEAVGEGALVGVHIPASGERRPHTLPQYLESLGTHFLLRVQPEAGALRSGP